MVIGDDQDDLKAFGLDKTSSHLRHPTRSVGASGELDVQPSAAKQREGWRSVGATKRRRWIIGFGPAPVAPGQSVTVTAQTRCVYQGEKLFNTGDVDDVYVTGFWVGKKSQLPPHCVPRRIDKFVDTGIHELMMDRCEIAEIISFTIENRGPSPRTVSLSIVGHVA